MPYWQPLFDKPEILPLTNTRANFAQQLSVRKLKRFFLTFDIRKVFLEPSKRLWPSARWARKKSAVVSSSSWRLTTPTWTSFRRVTSWTGSADPSVYPEKSRRQRRTSQNAPSISISFRAGPSILLNVFFSSSLTLQTCQHECYISGDPFQLVLCLEPARAVVLYLGRLY